MTTREVEVPKIPENTKEIVDYCLNETGLNARGKIAEFNERLISKFGNPSKEYDHFFCGDNAESTTFNLFSLGEYEIIKEPKYVIKLPFIDDGGISNYLRNESGIWKISHDICRCTRFTMDEVKTNPNLKGLEQFAVEVENDN